MKASRVSEEEGWESISKEIERENVFQGLRGTEEERFGMKTGVVAMREIFLLLQRGRKRRDCRAEVEREYTPRS